MTATIICLSACVLHAHLITYCLQSLQHIHDYWVRLELLHRQPISIGSLGFVQPSGNRIILPRVLFDRVTGSLHLWKPGSTQCHCSGEALCISMLIVSLKVDWGLARGELGPVKILCMLHRTVACDQCRVNLPSSQFKVNLEACNDLKEGRHLTACRG